MARVLCDVIYSEELTGEQIEDRQEAEQGFLQAAEEAGAVGINRTRPISAVAEGETLVRLIALLNDAGVPYAIAEQESRADEDGMPA